MQESDRIESDRMVPSRKVDGGKIKHIWRMLVKAFLLTPRFVVMLCLTLLPLKMTPSGLPSYDSLELSALTQTKSCSLVKATLCVRVFS